MKRFNNVFILVLLGLLLAACRGGASGSLTVQISGIPAGAAANVSVAGPGGYFQRVGQTQILRGLTSGSYVVNAMPVGGLVPVVSGSPVTLAPGGAASVDVRYQDGAASGITGAVRLAGSTQSARDLEAAFVPGEVIVKFKGGSLGPLAARAAAVGLEPSRSLAVAHLGLYKLKGSGSALTRSQDTLALVDALNARPDVEYAHPNYILEAAAVPNDPAYSKQWHYPAINLPAAWDISKGSPEVTVAIVDSGLALDHPDLKANMLSGYDFYSDAATSADGDGRDSDADDPGGATNEYHGTHVAGTIAAATNNALGVAGVSWNSKLLPVRVLSGRTGTVADAIDALAWSVGKSVSGVPNNPNPAQVINLSVGEKIPCSGVPGLQDALDVVNAAGAVTVVAAGNYNSDAATTLPASCNHVITVGSTTLDGKRAYYSNFGRDVDVMAPGGDLKADLNHDGVGDGILSTVKDPAGSYSYAYYEGTSMAAPHVAGAAALILSLNPELSPADVESIIKRGAKPISDATCALGCGAGLIDVAAALEEAGGAQTSPFTLEPLTTTLTVPPGGTASLDVALNRSAGFEAEVRLSVSGLPEGLSASFTPALTTGNSARLTLTAAEGLGGQYTLEIAGVAGDESASAQLVVIVGSGGVNNGTASTFVVACPSEGAYCDLSKVPYTELPSNQPLISYTIADVPAGNYRVFGFTDLNANQSFDTGEPQGAYPSLSNPAVVTAPARDINFSITSAVAARVRTTFRGRLP